MLVDATLAPMNDRFVRACRGEPVDCTPVWLMRQAGRYMPEYRALRQRYSMLELCREPELAAQVTLQPMRLGVDAAIFFSDILLPLEPMGAPIRFSAADGPLIDNPVRTLADVDRIHDTEPQETMPYVFEAIRIVRGELKVPLIGFAGAPFTLASYLIEGGRSTHYAFAKGLMLTQPEAWHKLMQRLSKVVARHLQGQIDAGVDAVQLFDSWAGQLSPYDYEQFVLPHVRWIFAELGHNSVPMLYFGTATSSLLEAMATSGATVIGVDWRVELNQAWTRIRRIAAHLAIQGNLDPVCLLAPDLVIEQRAKAILDAVGDIPGHIFNLGHGVLPQTRPDSVQRLVHFVHQYTNRGG